MKPRQENNKRLGLLEKYEKLDINNEMPMEVYFKENGKLFLYEEDSVVPYILKDIEGQTRNFSYVFGLPYTGKTFFCKHLVQNHGYELLDLNEVIAKIKVKKSPEDPDAAELVPKDLYDEVVAILDSPLNKSKRYCLDNLVNALLPEFEQVSPLIAALGTPKTFFLLKTEEKELRLRYKRIKLENPAPEDLNEGELEEYNNTLILPEKILADITTNSVKTVEVDTTLSEKLTKEKYEGENGRKLIIVKHDYNNLNLEITLSNLATEFQALYINVPKLIYSKFYENKEKAEELKKFYSKKEGLKGSNSELNFEQSLYYKYNPIHFEEECILSLIKEHINLNYKQNENTGLVILSGILNSDLLNEEKRKYILPLNEIKSILTLGALKAFIQISDNQVEIEEKLEEVLLEPPKKPVKKKDELDISGNMEGNMEGDMEGMEGGMEGEMEGNMEGEEGDIDPNDPDAKRPYNPFNKSWTDYNGIPRNYLQILRKLLQTEVKNHEVSSREVNSALKDTLVDVFLKPDFTEPTEPEIKPVESEVQEIEVKDVKEGEGLNIENQLPSYSNPAPKMNQDVVFIKY